MKPIPARDIIADALCRADAGMPSPATFAKADKVIEYLERAGWDLVERGHWIAFQPDTAEAFGYRSPKV